jgi:hypothetical protein
LGIFALVAFKRVTGNRAFFGVTVGELTIFAGAAFARVSFLWYKVIGCLILIGVGLGVEALETD